MRLPIELVAFAAASALAFATAAPCTLRQFPTARSARGVFFIGTALPDTLLTGPGTVKYKLGVGHSFSSGRDVIRGQLFRLDRVGAPWAVLLPAGAREVVLVPWDYDAECTPLPWGGNAQWVHPGVDGAFEAVLRDKAYWVDGRPTLDVTGPEYQPLLNGAGNGAAVSHFRLTPDEALDLFERLPLNADLAADAASALAPLAAWRTAQPELATRWPAAEIIRWYEYFVESQALTKTISPVSGTFRVVITLHGRDSAVVFSRTEPRPLYEERDNATTAPGVRPPIIGFYMMATCAPSVHALPSQYNGNMITCYHTLAVKPLLQSPERTVWRGSIEVNYLAGSDETWLDRAFVADLKNILHDNPPNADSTWAFFPGRWTRYADGRIEYEWELRVGGKPLIGIRAARVGSEVFKPR